MKKTNRFLSALLAVCMLLSLLPAAALAANAPAAQESAELSFQEIDNPGFDLKAEPENDAAIESLGYADDDLVTVVVVMEEKSLLDQGFTKREISLGDQNLVAAEERLSARQDELLAQISAVTGETATMGYRYSVLLTGFSVEVPYGTLAEIRAMDGVRTAFVSPVFSLPEDFTSDATDVQTRTFSTTTSFGSAQTWQELGYTGAGMRIAILDTGLDTDHPSFAAAPALADSSLTEKEVETLLPGLNAATLYAETNDQTLTAANVYHSAKVPFGFNYASASLDVTHDNDTAGDHGTHVAGIAAANKTEGTDVVGVAPDAQVLVMKVFQPTGGASFTDIAAALEDCYRLNVDAINMSLGIDAGFTVSGVAVWDEIFAKLEESDMIASVSAGNAYSAAYQNATGTGRNLASDPDNGIVSSPATYRGTTMVASLENTTNRVNYFVVGGEKLTYLDYNYDAGTNTPAFNSLVGEHTYVMVPGVGAEEDFAKVDVTDKIAVVKRGELAFTEKQTNAAAAGAKALIVYDNEPGDLFYVGDAGLLPNVFVTMESGAILEKNAANGTGKLEIKGAGEFMTVENVTGGQMSDFSSWGVAPNLQLEPDVTAPGGYIYSSVNGGYGIMSGTSMSAPHIAGLAALVLQYLHAEHPELSEAQMHTVAEALIMSTATPVMESEGAAYSPRKQGAGAANAYDAIHTDAYLTVQGTTPKVSLGDDDDRTGVWNFSFELNNFSDRVLSYELDASLLTDQVIVEDGVRYMGETSRLLSSEPTFLLQEGSLSELCDVNADGICDLADVQALLDGILGLTELPETAASDLDLNGDGLLDTADAQLLYEDITAGLTESSVVRVQPGQSVSVSVRIELNDEDRAYLEANYENGIYVEGFVRAFALDEDNADLSLPFMGFYGDWSDARVFDGGWYYDDAPAYERYLNILMTNYGPSEYYYGYFGMNSYVADTYDPAHNVLSPNDDTYFDRFSDIYLSLMRGVKSLTFTFTDNATGEVLWQDAAELANKSYYVASAGVCYPFILSDYFDMEEEMYDFTGKNGEPLANNTALTLQIDARLDDGDDQVDDSLTIPMTIDTEAPSLLRARKLYDVETGERYLELTVQDNIGAAAIALVSADGNEQYALSGLTEEKANEDGSHTYTVAFDASDMSDKIMVMLADYGMNESYYGLNLGGEGAAYGSLTAFQYNFNTGINSWVSFDADVNQDETILFPSGTNFVCAEYVNGYVYAQTETGALYGFAYDTMLADQMDLEPIFIAQLDNVYQDLAYSYAEGKLYGLCTTEYDGYPTTEILSINLNGAYYDAAMWRMVEAYEESSAVTRGGLYGLAMAIDDAGTIYVLGPTYDWDTETLSETGYLWSVGVELNEYTGVLELGWGMSEIGDTGITMDYLQSMTWDHNTEKLYWARFAEEKMLPVSQLIELETALAEGEQTLVSRQVGTLTGETCALIAPLSDDAAAKDAHVNVPEMDSSIPGTPQLTVEGITMNVGGKKQLVCDFDPWYTAKKDVLWTSSDSTVVTVNETGLVTAVSEGTATITVSNKDDETKSDSCTVAVTALDLHIDGIYTKQTAGTGATGGVQLYDFTMTDGNGVFTSGAAITAPEELNFGLDIASSTFGRGSIWACEYGNSGMIYEIDPETGVVKDVIEPVDGDHLYGMAYSEKLDSFAAIMDMYLYVDLPMTKDVYEEMQGSYNEELNEFMWHKLDLLPYLIDSNNGFVTGEDGNGASSEIVLCGVEILDNQTEQYLSTDYLGNYAGEVSYTSTQTIALLDNVGRIWYVDEITGMARYADDWSTYYVNGDFDPEQYNVTMMIPADFNGVEAVEYVDENGNKTYSVFVLRAIEETPLTDMFREGTMPRITYAFNDFAWAGKTAGGSDMFLLSLYDYWNNGTTNELYLYVQGELTGETDYDENWNLVYLKTPDQLYGLGDTGEHNIIATINHAEVTGGLDVATAEPEEAATQPLAAGIYARAK